MAPAAQDELISTGVDALIKLVHDRQRIEMSEAASVLGTSETTVEDWARVLENEGVLKLEYQFTKVFLVWADIPGKLLSAKFDAVSSKREELEKMIGSMMGRLETGGMDLGATEAEYREILKNLDGKTDKVALRLKELKQFDKENEQNYAAQHKELEALAKELSAVAQDVRAHERQLQKGEEILAAQKNAETAGRELARAFAGEITQSSDQLGKRLQQMILKINDERRRVPDTQEMLATAERMKAALAEADGLKKDLSASLKAAEQAQRLLKKDSRAAGLVALQKELQQAAAEYASLRAQSRKLSDQIGEQAAVVESLDKTVTALRERKAEELLDRAADKGRLIERDFARLSSMYKQAAQAKPETQSLRDAVAELDGLKQQAEGDWDGLSEKAKETMVEVEKQLQAFQSMLQKKEETLSWIYEQQAALATVKNAYNRQVAELTRANAQLVSAYNTRRAETDAQTKELLDAQQKLERALARKKELQQTADMLAEMRKQRDRLLTQLKVLAKEVKMLDLKTAPRDWSPAQTAKVASVQKRMTQATKEEEEFERKRAELTALIRKMWEEEDRKGRKKDEGGTGGGKGPGPKDRK